MTRRSLLQRTRPYARALLTPLAYALDDLFHDSLDVIVVLPFGVVVLELTHIAYPPDVIPLPRVFREAVTEFPPAHLLGHLNGFEHRAVAVTGPSYVVNRARFRI